jgi:anaerobic magnesium-protoporphyrin IX monomethyl ester cyclase
MPFQNRPELRSNLEEIMKVALIQSFWWSEEPPVYPLGLASLAASFHGRHDVRCFDENIFVAEGEDLLAELDRWQPEVIGLGMRNSDSLGYQDLFQGESRGSFSPLAHFRDTAEWMKSRFPNAILVAGGAAFTIFAGRAMQVAKDVDFGILGEAEASFPELLENLTAPENITGVAYRRGGSVILPSQPARVDFSRLPAPDRRLMDVRPYILSGVPWAVGIQSKRGCQLSCAYCVYPIINGRGVRFRDPSSVVDEIENMVRDFGLKRFQFADSVFNQPQSHAEEICRLIIERGIQTEWSAWYDIFPLNRSFVELASRAGCRVFELSPDSFSDNTLKELGKNIKCRDIVKACKLVRRIPGITLSLNFLIGVPGETLYSTIRLLLFLVFLKLFYRKRILVGPINLIRIMPGTAVFHRAVEEGKITTDTELLPLDSAGMASVFYQPPRGSGIEAIYHSLLRFGAIKRRLTGRLKRTV